MTGGNLFACHKGHHMIFQNQTKPEDFDGKEVDVFLVPGVDGKLQAINFCKVILDTGDLYLQFEKFRLKVPDDSILSRNEVNLEVGRYGILIRSNTDTGRALLDFVEQKKAYEQTKGGR
jgi:hypothetical protein